MADVDKWLKRVDAGLRFRDNEEALRGWKRFVDEYEGRYPGIGVNFQSRLIPINLVFAYVHTEIARLYFRNPYVAVNPRGMRYIQRAKILEVAINYLLEELGIKREMLKVLMDALLVGHGWMKYGYAGTFGSIKTPSETKFLKSKGDKWADEVSEFVRSEEIFAVHVPWRDVVFDQSAIDPPYDCRWIAHRVVKPLESVKQSELYKNTAGLKSNFHFERESGVSVDYPLVEIWEIWDKDSTRVLVAAKGYDKLLRDIENPLLMDGLPFSMLKFNTIPGKAYPLSDIGIIEPQVLERIKMRTMMLNHIKRWSRQVFVEKGAMNEKEKEKYELGIDGSIIELQTGGTTKIRFPEYPPMQTDIWPLDNLVQMDMDTVIGQNQIDRGQQAQTRTRTLGEVQLQRLGSQSRSDRRRDVIEEFMEEVARKIIQLAKQFQLTSRYVRNLDADPVELRNSIGERFDGSGMSFSKEDIQGEYDLDVKMGSMIPLNKENRLELLTEVLKLGPAAGILPGGPVARTIGREVLRDLHLKEVERAFAQEEKLHEMAALQAQQQGLPPVPVQALIGARGVKPGMAANGSQSGMAAMPVRLPPQNTNGMPHLP